MSKIIIEFDEKEMSAEAALDYVMKVVEAGRISIYTRKGIAIEGYCWHTSWRPVEDKSTCTAASVDVRAKATPDSADSFVVRGKE